MQLIWALHLSYRTHLQTRCNTSAFLLASDASFSLLTTSKSNQSSFNILVLFLDYCLGPFPINLLKESRICTTLNSPLFNRMCHNLCDWFTANVYILTRVLTRVLNSSTQWRGSYQYCRQGHYLTLLKVSHPFRARVEMDSDVSTARVDGVYKARISEVSPSGVTPADVHRVSSLGVITLSFSFWYACVWSPRWKMLSCFKPMRAHFITLDLSCLSLFIIQCNGLQDVRLKYLFLPLQHNMEVPFISLNYCW